VGEYQGVANLTGPDGEPHAVLANLQSWVEQPSGLLSWGGTVSGSVKWFTLEGVTISLSVGDRSSDCYVEHFEVTNPLSSVRIVGEGVPPFD
jgi:hypothetical protein